MCATIMFFKSAEACGGSHYSRQKEGSVMTELVDILSSYVSQFVRKQNAEVTIGSLANFSQR